MHVLALDLSNYKLCHPAVDDNDDDEMMITTIMIIFLMMKMTATKTYMTLKISHFWDYHSPNINLPVWGAFTLPWSCFLIDYNCFPFLNDSKFC